MLSPFLFLSQLRREAKPKSMTLIGASRTNGTRDTNGTRYTLSPNLCLRLSCESSSVRVPILQQEVLGLDVAVYKVVVVQIA